MKTNYPSNAVIHGAIHTLIGGRQCTYLGDVLHAGRLFVRAVGACTCGVCLEQTLLKHTAQLLDHVAVVEER